MKVAVTGGIGAGKSEFMRAVKELGIRTYSADEINAELLRDKRYIEKLSEAFPLAVKDGKVDKSVLREEVFSDEKKRKTLNALAHPEIRRKIEEITGDAVIEVPLLFESGMTDLFDRVIVVTAGEDVRINRVVSTRNISKDLAKNIIKNQTTDDERLKRADYVAINDGTRKDLYEQAKNIIKGFLNNNMENVLDILGGVKDYAHRGCFDKTLPENSLTAIRIAADKGLGLEIDVHLTKDNKLVVFHDHTLKRMCGVSGIVEEMTESQLTALKLKNTSHTIPTLKDVLAAVDGRTPILIELKCRNNEIALCDALIDELKSYNGKYMYIGFNEKAAKYFKDKGYTIALSCFKPKTPKLDFKPDFLLCNIMGIPRSKKKRAKYPPFISWTIESERGRKKSEETSVATIYNTANFNF